MKAFVKPASALLLAMSGCLAFGQHLIWRPDASIKDATCIYGRITVLATNKTIYYCGCNWWPGSPAGGYTGIQDAGNGRHVMIFSIWDTSNELHPTITYKMPDAVGSRFGGEGTGAHTHFDYPWKVGQTYQFFAIKKQDADKKNTLTSVFFYDRDHMKWVHEATISNPNGGFKNVTTFGGYLNSFLENWSGQERSVPKLAEYQLWMGTSPESLKNITSASGDGKWGVMNNQFFLAEGDDSALQTLFDKFKGSSPFTVHSGRDKAMKVNSTSLSKGIIRELKKLASQP